MRHGSYVFLLGSNIISVFHTKTFWYPTPLRPRTYHEALISDQASQCYLGVTNTYFSMSMVVSTRLIKTTAVQALQAHIPHELRRCWLWDSNKVAASSQRIVMHLNLSSSASLHVDFIKTTNTPKTCVSCAPKHICSDVNGGKFSSVAAPHILLGTLLSEHPWSTFFLWVTDLISHPYRTTQLHAGESYLRSSSSS